MAHEVFISHAEPDRPAAEAIRAALEKRVILCWTPPAGARHGDEWNQAVAAAIRDASVVLLIFTSRANDSMQVRRELERAVTEGMPILPVSIEAVAPEESLDSLLGPVQWMDASPGPLENHLDKICRSVAKRLGRELGPVGKSPDELAQAAPLDHDMRVAPPSAKENLTPPGGIPPAQREQAPRQSPSAAPPGQSPHAPPLASTPPAQRIESERHRTPPPPKSPAAPARVIAPPVVEAPPAAPRALPLSSDAPPPTSPPVIPAPGSPRAGPPAAPPRDLRTAPGSPSQPAATIPAAAPVAGSRQQTVPMASQLTPAPMNRRIAAAVADTIVSSIGLFIMAATAAEGKDPPAWFAIVSLLFPVGYWVISEGLGGATPGKRFLRLRVVSVHGGRCTFMQAWKRTLLRMVDYLPLFYLVGLIVALRNPWRQRLGDRWAGTMVIEI